MKDKPYILFVAPTVYPICGAEGYVNAKLVKALSESGFKIDILSRGISRHVFYPLEEDDGFFFSKVNAKYVISIDTAYDIKTLVRHLLAFLKTGYLYKGMDWAYPAVRKCEELHRENKYDFIYTFDFPSEVVGLYMAKKYGLKWVSTWNDPYTLEKYPEPYGRGQNARLPFLHRKLIADMGKAVYRNIFPSKRLRDYMLGYMTNMKKESCVICPHINLSYLNRSLESNHKDVLSILHSGNLGNERNPSSFIEGFSLFLKKYPTAQVRVTFLGINNSENSCLAPLLDKYQLKDYIRTIPSVSYFQSLDIVSEYDVCMLIEASCEEGIFLPSKVADYMQCQKPIWAISPMIGTMNDMYKSHDINYFSNVLEPQSVFKTLETIYTDYMSGTLMSKRACYEKYMETAVLETHLSDIACLC